VKLVASLIVKNELDRYLPEVIGHLLDFCDQIVVLDDGSTDRTGEWLDDNATGWEKVVVHHVDPEDGFFAGHEGRKRQQLLIHTLNEHPDWVLNIDADEFVTDGVAIREYANGPREVGSLAMEEVWKVEKGGMQIRMDGGWRPHPVPCFWAARLSGQRGRALRIADKPLACGREPEVVRRYFGRSRPTGASILHLGWANQSERRPRYERYVVADGGRFHRNSHLESIMFPDIDVTLEDRGWPKPLIKYRDLIVARANLDHSGGYA
jgi:glycosyltransferase involved in cell wall biosynthesis